VNKQRIFIIGGSGFVGSHLTDYLLQHQYDVFSPTSREFNLLDKSTWKPLEVSPSVAIICASEISDNAESMKLTNEDPLEDLYAFLKENGIQKLIYLSSGAVYGSYSGVLSPETPCYPNTHYGHSKFNSERILSSVCENDLNILRLFFPYGPNQKLPRLIPRMVDSIKKRIPIICNADGGPHISVTHVYDIANIITSDFIVKDSRDRVTNIASPVVLSIKEIAERLSQTIGIPALYEQNLIESSNCISVPYQSVECKYSDSFEGIVNESV
jgi:nucleoside-diphosphate-sugar epimerase